MTSVNLFYIRFNISPKSLQELKIECVLLQEAQDASIKAKNESGSERSSDFSAYMRGSVY
ncbi:MAG: hypothetical protein CMH49_01975 [Myxococcales bacterium]|nr:hypothetical protein [Myxococcales bacterium]